ncbi:hypothetical protein [Nocardioides sp.]|uniref:hypothetical protein n=1 Tax=Nocardioides sp. TaxID=35761 RepID=UPI002C7450F5|nr:hypothetical protein [Nocardioides sp.]HXH79613.1 hypothetical protein [Nocardioides sp.]
MSGSTVQHQILAAVTDIGQALKSVADTNATFMATADKATALVELSQIEARVSELRLRILVDAGDVAEATGARDAAAWLAHATHARFEDAHADLRLTTSLDRACGPSRLRSARAQPTPPRPASSSVPSTPCPTRSLPR